MSNSRLSDLVFRMKTLFWPRTKLELDFYGHFLHIKQVLCMPVFSFTIWGSFVSFAGSSRDLKLHLKDPFDPEQIWNWILVDFFYTWSKFLSAHSSFDNIGLFWFLCWFFKGLAEVELKKTLWQPPAMKPTGHCKSSGSIMGNCHTLQFKFQHIWIYIFNSKLFTHLS